MGKVNFFDCASDPSKSKKRGEKAVCQICAKNSRNIWEKAENKDVMARKESYDRIIISSSAPYRNNELD